MTKRAPSTSRAARSRVPAGVLAKLRAITRGLAGSVEDTAWTGVRWKVRGKTYAHVLVVESGRPAAYAKAIGAGAADAPSQVVLTFRADGPPYDALCEAGPPFFRAQWGVTWGAKVIAMTIDARTDWARIEALLAESHRLFSPATDRAGAPRPRPARRLASSGGANPRTTTSR